MEFKDEIQRIRKASGLTQEEFAERLCVTRQAVSNWENDRNLPDLGMLIAISQKFGVSLDQLILGGKSVNNLTEKLIKDGSEMRRARLNLAAVTIGAVLMLLGLACLFIKSNSVEYVDETGLLHENFYLIPIGMALVFGGFVTLMVTGIRQWLKRSK